MIKKIIKSLTLCSICLAFLACGDKSKDNDRVKIRLLTRMAGTSNSVKVYKDIIYQFEQKYPDVIVVDESQGDESSFNNKLKTDLASGTLPNIFRIQGVANLGEYVDTNLLADMKPILDEDKEWGEGFNKGALNYYTIPGKDGIYAIPMEQGLMGFYYNKDLFNKAGVEKFPETWDEFLVAIDKLKGINVIPIALGAKSTYSVGHLHNQIFYRWLGVDAAKKLGSREIKWTDPEVVQTLEFIKVLNDKDAFSPSAPGISNDIATTQFKNGEAAMIFTGPWNISTFVDSEKTPVYANIDFAKFPYFKEKAEFKNQDMQVISPYMISGNLKGKEKDYTIELLKMLTSKDAGIRYVNEAEFLLPRIDFEADKNKVGELFLANNTLAQTSDGIGVDVFDFDKIPSMQDRTRNSIVSVLMGASPMEAGKEIQEEISRKE
ncbi:MAG: ABC transporter substrate-binding protein [Cetobacterium sp.]|uniref:ABC transporter substrate-binding protein n=1 Tax=Cetobacterium TaxID=180162 RepID=UPI001F05FB53|nr:extracellular solute-binding protein [Cetobacterium somerae]UPO98702.1 extracellular solute-binding protein [Cetobacterium somerae]